VLPATRHKWTQPTLTTAHPGGIVVWVDLGDLLHTEMIYPRETVTHPSTNRAQCRLTALMEANALTITLGCQLKVCGWTLHVILLLQLCF